MAAGFSADDVHHQIDEWWDHAGAYHEGAPSEEQLLDEAVQITMHVWDDDGNDYHFTSFSDEGWTEYEIDVDVEDSYGHYVGGEQ